MDWLPALENASDYWDSNFPIINTLCIEDFKWQESAPRSYESRISQLSLSLEPRSISSSEFEELSSNSSEDEISRIPELNIGEKEIENLDKTPLNHILNGSLERAKPEIYCQKKNEKTNIYEKKPKWSKEEDSLIFELYNKYGGNWKKISTFLPGKIAIDIKNRFYGTLKRRRNPMGSSTIESMHSQLNFSLESKDLILYQGKSWKEDDIIDSFLMNPSQINQIKKNESQINELESHLKEINFTEKKSQVDNSGAKRQKLLELYNKISTIDAFISQTKQKMQLIEIALKKNKCHN
ncbi:unnamed protein product [Blepharisma stoltei]|uniref:Myb-like DNA-binding domain containing protein n=1 Tax=Blepharisma stoltei TaxID=1481888 RepID=A0AAU9JPL3_9CILI|nr:unnamed protein product [Blepharisma stoltei]